MGDVRDWLRGYNLEQYADAFEANDIDLDVLAELDDHDLETRSVAGQPSSAFEGDRGA
jgi:hypothetical protein